MGATKIVPDTSIVVSGLLTDLIGKGRLPSLEDESIEIIIPYFVMEELRSQAGSGRSIGVEGLNEIKKLRLLSSDKIKLSITGRRQTIEEIKLAKAGRIDALIIDIAKEEKAILYTSDRIQALAAEAEGIVVRFYEPYERKIDTTISKMMTDDTMSLHIKENCVPLAKIGKPGSVQLVRVSEKPLKADEIEEIIQEILDAARYEPDSFIEMGGRAASVVQLGNMRIAIARPPFSDGLEITVVRPITKLALDDYKMSPALKQRIAEKVEGVIIAGPPGSGKSTFAAAVAEFFDNKGKIVKTFESPRDLQVGPSITQYGKLRGSYVNTADILLLVRPDYTVFDEVRKTEEFEVFSDMRLAGIGMIGVVHATQPIDAIQRFMSRTELGVIPHIIDTIIFIEAGQIKEVFELSLTVRTPTGMTEADLARPVVEVRDFETKKLVYEIYTYGEENVVIPVGDVEYKKNGLHTLAKKQLLSELKRIDPTITGNDIEIMNDSKAMIKIDNDLIARVIGQKGKNIKALEDHLGISIEVQPKVATTGRQVDYEIDERGNAITFMFMERYRGEEASFYYKDEFLFSAIIGNKGQVRVGKSSELGRRVLSAVLENALNVYI